MDTIESVEGPVAQRRDLGGDPLMLVCLVEACRVRKRVGVGNVRDAHAICSSSLGGRPTLMRATRR
jgi:hypothetical protein